jgi:hypothetical protein
MVCGERDPPCGLLIGRPMHKLRFALLSVAFVAMAVVVYALQTGAALHQWLTGRTRRTFRITLLRPRRRTFRITLLGPRAKRSSRE